MTTRRVWLAAAAVAVALGGCSSNGGGGPAGDGGVVRDSAPKPDARTCAKTKGPRPSARAEMMGVFDPKRRRLVFFGGDNGVPVRCNPAPRPIGTTWVYDAVCADFRRITGSEPPPRARGMAIYDPVGDRMILFGGRYRAARTGAYTVYNDAWALDLGKLTWKKLATTGTPPAARSNPAGGYSATTREMIVFGGNTSTSGLRFEPLDDVWALNLNTLAWRKVKASGTKPEARLFHAAVVDSATQQLYVYGGGGRGAFRGPFMGDLWRMDLKQGTWTRLHDGKGTGVPAGRIWSTVTWDAGRKRLLLFGGHDDGSVGNNNDTWAFSPATKRWKVITKPETVNKPAAGFCNFPPKFTLPNLDAPDRRSAQLAALDPARGEWIVFGGKTDCGIIDDVWTFDLGRDSWLRLLKATKGEACVRGDNPTTCVSLCKN